MPRLTVIIPVLNAMPYLPKALASLETQAFRDFTVILWDNGSTDGSVQEAKRWIPGRLAGRVVDQHPLPLHRCLDAMVRQADTPYIARMDGDDVALPDRFAIQVATLDSDQQLAAVGAQCLEVDACGQPLAMSPTYPEHYADILSAFLTCNAILHPTVMFRREIILESGNYGSCASPCEDFDLWLRVAKHFRVANLPQILLRYRIHSASIINSSRSAGALEAPNRRCIQTHSQDLFGLSPRLYGRLRERRVYLAALPLLGAARAIATRADVSLRAVLGSPSFLFSARCLTPESDWISRLVWRFCQRRWAA